jgi:hypothetical protein
MKRVGVTAQWLKRYAKTVGTWWGIMSGAFSIPFALLALFYPPRLAFAALAYLSLWVLVIGQIKRVAELQKRLELPNVSLRIGHGLMDGANDFDMPVPATWVRGSIKNTGNRGIEGCRVKLLKVEGQNLPDDIRRVENGFLQWQGGVRDSMRLDAGEYRIFDIGTRSYKFPDIPLRLCVHFVTGPQAPLISCSLQPPGTYTMTLAIYGNEIQSTEQTFTITLGEGNPDDVQFPSSV